MCGIAGIYKKNGIKENDNKSIHKMSECLAHRGPDAEGFWKDNNICMAHRRLSIIDRSENSNQPMVSSDGCYIIVYNGEIYNYIEIRNKLKSQGVSFKTAGDTEVILEAYRLYGVECFKMFNGMWSLAVYDMNQNKIVLCRDRFGVKPLFYVLDGDTLIFSSEMGAIISTFPQYKVPYKRSIYRYLVDGINEDSDETTFYEAIKSFPASHYMIVDLEKNSFKKRKYWEVNIDKFEKKWIIGKKPYSTFKRLFKDAVAIRLRSDVEVGVCLSGGLDSSSILGCAAKLSERPIQTFSSIYDDPECNEEQYIRDVNQMWNTIHHYVKPDDDEGQFIEHLKRIIFHHGQPVNGASLYSQYKVMEKVGENVRVVLDGQGADELFAGYLYYFSYYIRELLDKNDLFSRFKAIKELVIIKKYWPDMIKSVGTDDIVRAVGLKHSFLFQDTTQIKQCKDERKLIFFTDSFIKSIETNPYNNTDEMVFSSVLNKKLCTDLMRDSIPSLLHNEDGNSMAFSVESRVPFLDYRIVEFSLALDAKYKIRNKWTKWIIRKSLKDYLPQKVLKRKNKMGFPAPFSRWLISGKSCEEYKKLIYEFAKRNIVPKETVEYLYNAHIDGETDYSDILFKYLCIELWYQMIDDPVSFLNKTDKCKVALSV